MSRLTWVVELEQSGNNFVSDGTLYRPNSNFPITIISNKQRVKLANGDIGTVTPEIKQVDGDLTFVWLAIESTDTLITKIETYIANDSRVRITDHLGNQFTGSFISFQKIEMLGQTIIDLIAVFLQF